MSSYLDKFVCSWFVALLLLPALAPRTGSAASLTVAAAADLASVERPLADAFHQTYPADSVRFVLGASGALSQQIANGAPYDVFLSANEAFVDQLAVTGKVVPDTVYVYALGQLAVAWRDGQVHRLSELTAKWVRFVALPNPKLAPYGARAQQALEAQGIWPQVRTKVVMGENVRQALQLFESGNADAVMTALSLVEGRTGITVVPQDLFQPIRQKAGIVASTKQPDLARRFLALLSSPAGARILSSHGLQPAHSRQ